MWIRSAGLHGAFVGAHAVLEGAITLRQLKEGPYFRVLRGVYADPSLPRDHLLRCRAAALLLPDGAVLGGRSAAAIYGAPAPDHADPVTVVLPKGMQWRGPAGVRVHRAALPASDRCTVDDLPCTVLRRSVWDVAALESTATAVGVLDAMVHSGTVDVADLHTLLATAAGRRRSQRVRRAFELVDGRSESPPESWVRVACAFARLPAPVPQHEVFERGVWLARADLAWPEHKVIVEYDGPHHFEGDQVPKDDGRIARLVAAGWRVIRLAAADVRDMDSVIRRIAAALGVHLAR
jgi:hypothetical protein